MKAFIKKLLPNSIKDFVRFMIDLNNLIYGLIIFKFFKKRLNGSYLSFIRIFCKTKGISNDLLTFLIKIRHKPYKINKANGILGNLSATDINKITNELITNGYYISQELLSKEICDRLINFALTNKAYQHSIEDETAGKYTLYNREEPKATKYSFDFQDLINLPEIQDIIADPSIIAITQSYMKSKVYFDQSMLWWSTAFQAKPDSSAAQLFHFDMDRIKWLKIFVYLTEVNLENGPHTFVAGSQRSKGIPAKFLKKGYSRLTDQEVLEHYGPEPIIQFTGPVGTIIIEDTRGLHKGEPLIKGDRLILEFQFSNHMFGAVTPEGKFLNLTNTLKQTINSYPKIYSTYSNT